ncbi:helix-turn-helix domain-containing protein [Methylobacterium sp. J-092]|uniref:helix-turn-helix domain-containing protein n=1 Tax=Methylobacterium sp. J-092 TaxID=2836667 RepID=UPI001FB9938A|nr:AraC family transcriptional regulator [Methylobacterium sp. J-092]MCJ2010884.1 AraC family transcriptional regulator [Methylobacterium sp. J-092]
MSGLAQRDPAALRSQDRIVARIGSLRQLQLFNDRGGIAVNFDILRSAAPDIRIAGSQSETFSLWETTSASGFVTKPKFDADLVTIRFVTSGSIAYRYRAGEAIGLPSHATLVGFEDLREVQASSGFGAISGTIPVAALMAANAALTGGGDRGFAPLAPIAAMTPPGVQMLFCTLRQIHAHSHGPSRRGNLIVPLIQEILSYQLLSVWPKRDMPAPQESQDVPLRRIRAALDYIEAHLSDPLTLADIATAAGISVRSLQDRFRQAIGQTPVQFIIDRRLRKVHHDLTARGGATLSIAEVAARWGFVHMSDSGQRYRRLYGCAPSETRRDAGRPR